MSNATSDTPVDPNSDGIPLASTQDGVTQAPAQVAEQPVEAPAQVEAPKEEMPPEMKKAIEDIHEAMKLHPVSYGAEIMLAARRLYWTARHYMIAMSDGKLTERNFQLVSDSLAQEAVRGFKIGQLKNHIKRGVMPFLQRLSVREARMVERPNASGQQPAE